MHPESHSDIAKINYHHYFQIYQLLPLLQLLEGRKFLKAATVGSLKCAISRADSGILKGG